MTMSIFITLNDDVVNQLQDKDDTDEQGASTVF